MVIPHHVNGRNPRMLQHRKGKALHVRTSIGKTRADLRNRPQEDQQPHPNAEVGLNLNRQPAFASGREMIVLTSNESNKLIVPEIFSRSPSISQTLAQARKSGISVYNSGWARFQAGSARCVVSLGWVQGGLRAGRFGVHLGIVFNFPSITKLWAGFKIGSRLAQGFQAC